MSTIWTFVHRLPRHVTVELLLMTFSYLHPSFYKKRDARTKMLLIIVQLLHVWVSPNVVDIYGIVGTWEHTLVE